MTRAGSRPRLTGKYLVSLPERVVRSLGALSGGLIQELAEVVIPARLRRTALYRTMVQVTLRFLIEDLGQVEGVFPADHQGTSNFLLKRTASHGIELLGILAFHVSPVWVLAALADVTGGGHQLIERISEELKKEGLLEPGLRFQTMDQLLDGLENTSANLARTLNMPPVNVDELRREWHVLQRGISQSPAPNVPSIEKLESVWDEIGRLAAEQERSVFAVSSALALSSLSHIPGNLLWLSRATGSAARTAGKVLGHVLLDHYVGAARQMSAEGFGAYWQREFRPYLKGAAEQFVPAHESATERLLRKRSRRTQAPEG